MLINSTCVIRMSRFAILLLVFVIYEIGLCCFSIGDLNYSTDLSYILFIYPIPTYSFVMYVII